MSFKDNIFVGKEISGYKLTKQIGKGAVGAVYKGELISEEVNDERAIKLIPSESLDTRPGWQNEINKVTQLTKSVDAVVPYIDSGEEVIDGISLRWIAWALIDGKSLRDEIQGGTLTFPLLCEVIHTVLEVLHACKHSGINHGDLHPGNILIDKPNPLRLNPDRQKVWVTDFGYLTSSMGKPSLDDFLSLARLISECLDGIDFHILEGREKFQYSRLKNDFLLRLRETTATEGIYVRSPRDLFELFDQILNESPPNEGRANRRVGDYLAAEMLGYRFGEWNDLFVSKTIGVERLITRNICVMTGLRGCGKTMLFRRLTALFDYHLGPPKGLAGTEDFIGFYVNARAIAEAFPWLPSSQRGNAHDQVIHYFHVCWICEMLDWLSLVVEKNQLKLGWLNRFFRQYFGDKIPDYGEGGFAILHIHNFFLQQKKISKLESGYSESSWELSDLNFLDELVRQLRANVPDFSGESGGSKSLDKFIFLFLDDYSTPLVTHTIQEILNEIVFRRSDQYVFKVATESVESFSTVGLNRKTLEEDDDYHLIDLSTEVLKRSLSETRKLVTSLLEPRINWDSRFTDSKPTLPDVLGKTRLTNIGLAEEIRKGNNRVQYQGEEVFCRIWSSNTRDLITLFSNMLERSNLDELSSDSFVPPIVPDRIQDQLLRETGGRFRSLLVSAIDPTKELHEHQPGDDSYGEHLQSIVDALGFIAAYELKNVDSKNGSRTNPKQARRIEVSDVSEELPPDILRYYVGLIRYGVLIRDWRGKSARGKAVPRLFLRSLLIPYYSITFSKKDSLMLDWSQFCKLLKDPDKFQKGWRKGKRNEEPGMVQDELL